MSKEDGRLCSNCRFCTPYATPEYGDPSLGFCRRRAPFPGESPTSKGTVRRTLAEFPVVYKADTYCFEHEPVGQGKESSDAQSLYERYKALTDEAGAILAGKKAPP